MTFIVKKTASPSFVKVARAAPRSPRSRLIAAAIWQPKQQ
jgi:hypothetical protein